jgi:large subunit ribosomal protein L25
MATRITVSAAPRTQEVKAKVLRRQDKVPAVLYGHDYASQTLQFDYLSAVRLVQQAGTSQLVMLNVEGDDQEHMVLIRQIQRDPVTEAIIHLDLYRLVAGVAVTTEVPVVQRGVAPVIESLGGIVNQLLDTIEIECMPQDMPQHLELDVSSLVDFSSFLTVADIDVPDGVRILVSPDTELIRVLMPRSEEELEEAATIAVEEVEVVGEEEGVEIEGEEIDAGEIAEEPEASEGE